MKNTHPYFRPKECWLWAVGTLAFAMYSIICLLSGASLWGMIGFFVAVPFYLVVPGMALQQWIGPKQRGVAPMLWMLYGCSFFVALVCFCVRLQLVWILQLLPPVVSAIFLWLNRNKIPKAAVQIVRKKAAARMVALWGCLCLLFALFHSAQNPHPIVAESVSINRDLLWNIGNGNALMQAFPAQDIRFVEVRFSYHYLTELVAAGMCLVSGASSYDVFTFFSGPVFLAGELVALYMLGRCFYQDSRKKAAALIALVLGFQCASMWGVFQEKNSIFANTLLKHLITNINSQATALIFLCIFTVLFVLLAKEKFAASWQLFGACLLSFALLTLAKGPQAAIVLCSLAVTMVIVLVFQKPRYLAAITFLVATVAIFVVLYRFLFSSGANSSMTFSIFSMQQSLPYMVLSPWADWLCAHLPISGYVWLTLIGVINVFCMLPFQFVLWLRGLPTTIKGLFHLEPGHILANGIVAGGFLAYHLFWHPNSSQAYFALLGMLFLSVLAVEQLDKLWRKTGVFRWVAATCGVVGLCTTLCMVISYGATGIQQLTVSMGITQAQPQEGSVFTEDEQAMEWLRQNSDFSMVFATNRTSGFPSQTDGISNVYSAFSGRQAYMEGWTYAVSNMGVSQEVVDHRLQVNEKLFSPDTTVKEIEELCRTEQIQWLVYAKEYPGEVSAQLTPQFENDHVAIYYIGEE